MPNSSPRVAEGPQRAGGWHSFGRLAPFELWAYGGALVALLFLRSRGLRWGWSAVEFVLWGVGAALPTLFALGIATQIVARALRRQPVRSYLKQVATAEWLLLWGRLWLVGAAYAYTYIWLKISVPLVRTDLFDPELWRIDRVLHFGISPTILAVELTRGTVLPALLDRWYALWVPSVPLAFAYVTAHLRSDLRRNFVLANVLLWSAGAWLYLAIPALGPCYATPEIVEPIRAEMPKAMNTQAVLFAHYGKMIQSRGRVLESFSPMLGVAAMPSLHVGVHWLFALWAKRYERRLFLPLVLATGLTFFGSLVTTWHYAIDGYAGMLLAWLAIRLADRFEPAAGEADPAANGAPAAAPVAGTSPEHGVPS